MSSRGSQPVTEGGIWGFAPASVRKLQGNAKTGRSGAIGALAPVAQFVANAAARGQNKTIRAA